MRILNKISFFVLFLCFLTLNFILMQSNSVFAEEYPLPNDAVLKLEKAIPVGPTTSIVRSYSTMLNKDQIMRFFQKELLKLGWQEQYTKGLGYVKGDKIISVLVLSGKPHPNDKKTYFSVVYATKLSDEMMKASQKDTPDNLNFMPVYPGSKQLLLWDNANGVMGTYSVDAPIEKVAAYFKNKMPSYGWKLVFEKPVSEKSGDCPSCKKKVESVAGMKEKDVIKGKFYTADLKYQRAKGERCSISITSSNYKDVLLSQGIQESGYTPAKDFNTKITISYRDTNTNAQR